MILGELFKVIQGHQITDEELYLTEGKIPVYTGKNEIKGYWNKEIIELKPDAMPIAIYFKMETFNTQTVELEKGDMIYTFSDGYIDQFGGPKGKKFMKSRFKQLLLEIAELPVNEQKEILVNSIENWMGILEQIDDMLIIGLKIT